MTLDEQPASTDRKGILAETLVHRILTMQLEPGAVLDEVALSEEFGLSRPPVRELMRQMAGEGYVDLEANRAARVSIMSYQTLRDFLIVAPMIYVGTTKLAAVNRTAGDLDVLKATQQRFRRSIADGDVESRVIFNHQFHLNIGRMAHNPYLLPSLKKLLIDHARIGKIFYRQSGGPRIQKDQETAAQQHDQMIEAIEAHDADRAGDVVRAHLEVFRSDVALYAVPNGMQGELER
ncbi:MAG: GntR family transcriptional regulator [Mesorhizobium sp.]|uniref:GntR family transcriptional regulator n=2 Tax=Mesorhizobium TaxID=68287 RepID=UPI000FD29AE9|nr:MULTISPECIES: GntR family transcriptional regulator [unclassified Mesorhizobium]RVD42602.1 GntR family transcriptional regulator [Mesorhizobium sp. M4A.F.Ca.ET.020.02.1.1]RWC18396.1 MAG: GntR family transcriptional regulator [Mesorhizobium sp.]RWC27371.1 MAG: GntR family transcriptional regulator [Mesorhizobium sp.]RWC55870.1 MAG: GntR family transcriptional regulator [Mesorhizobium sp.]RWD42242.1 MAG: GntR family transcriptional regulator [Mesorhizobium sp.]